MKLTKRVRKLLINPVCFGWSLYEQHSGAFYWDADSALRFKPSLSFQACIEKRLLEELPGSGGLKRYRATILAFKFKCPETLCRHGHELSICEEEGIADMTGNKCPVCDGIGLISEIKD